MLVCAQVVIGTQREKSLTQFWESWKTFTRKRKVNRVEWLNNSAWKERDMGLNLALLCDICLSLNLSDSILSCTMILPQKKGTGKGGVQDSEWEKPGIFLDIEVVHREWRQEWKTLRQRSSHDLCWGIRTIFGGKGDLLAI